MSRAFVKEPDGDQFQDDQPELPISPHPNYVTPNGLKQLKDKHADLLKKKNELKGDDGKMSRKTTLKQIERELRYFNSRIHSAILVNPEMQDKNVVAVGATVKVIDKNMNAHRFTIVGEDEANIFEDKISWISPLASVMIGKEKGDQVIWKRPIGDLTVCIDEIVYP